jgi:hypothetical protein
MATLMDDGSLLIHAALDAPFEEVVRGFGAKRVKAVDPFNLSPVRAAQLSIEQRQVVIKERIKELQAFDKNLSFAKAWTILRSTRPDLFDR